MLCSIQVFNKSKHVTLEGEKIAETCFEEKTLYDFHCTGNKYPMKTKKKPLKLLHTYFKKF